MMKITMMKMTVMMSKDDALKNKARRSMMRKPATESTFKIHKMHVAEIILMCLAPEAEEDKKHHDDK